MATSSVAPLCTTCFLEGLRRQLSWLLLSFFSHLCLRTSLKSTGQAIWLGWQAIQDPFISTLNPHNQLFLYGSPHRLGLLYWPLARKQRKKEKKADGGGFWGGRHSSSKGWGQLLKDAISIQPWKKTGNLPPLLEQWRLQLILTRVCAKKTCSWLWVTGPQGIGVGCVWVLCVCVCVRPCVRVCKPLCIISQCPEPWRSSNSSVAQARFIKNPGYRPAVKIEAAYLLHFVQINLKTCESYSLERWGEEVNNIRLILTSRGGERMERQRGLPAPHRHSELLALCGWRQRGPCSPTSPLTLGLGFSWE